MRPFVHLGECYGKTVEAVSPLRERAFITFTDGTYTSIEAVKGYDGDVELETNDDFIAYHERSILDKLGIESMSVLEAEHEAAEAARNKRRDEADLAQYERLKKKFG